MNINLRDKTALVCGSTQGIGKAVAKQFAECGAKVVLIARNKQSLQSTLAELTGSGHEYLVADFDDVDSVATSLKNYLVSGNRLDIVVNNSGGPAGGVLENAASEDFMRAMNRLLLSSHTIVKACLPSMKHYSFGRIINIISTSVRQPIDNLGVSNTIRAATASWAKTLSREVAGSGITVNNILPGATLTARLESIIENAVLKTGRSREEVVNSMLEEIPMKRFCSPDEIAYSAAFLASDYASYITGTNITIDGGRTKAL